MMPQQSEKKRYSSNLSEDAWRCLKPHLPVTTLGRPREVSLRQVINAILYRLNTGCQWRQLPREFPAWTVVHDYFRRWFADGTWARLHHLLHARLRQMGYSGRLPDGMAERFKFYLAVVLYLNKRKVRTVVLPVRRSSVFSVGLTTRVASAKAMIIKEAG